MQSQSVIAAWKAEGRREGLTDGMALGLLEGRRADVLRALQLRFGASAPPEIAAVVRHMEDIDQLGRWFDAAVTAASLPAFAHTVAVVDRLDNQRRAAGS